MIAEYSISFIIPLIITLLVTPYVIKCAILTFSAISFVLSYKLIHSINPASIEFLDFETTLIVVLSVQLFTLWVAGLYKETIRKMGISTGLRITKSVGYAVCGSAIALFIMDSFPFISGVLIFILGIRIVYQALSYWFHREKKSGGENIIIYGANENGTMILHKINNSSNTDLKVIGFLDDDPNLEGKIFYGYPIFGNPWKLAKTLRHRKVKVDYIFICEEDIKPENFNRLKSLAESNGIKIKRLQIRLKNILTNTKDQNSISSILNGPTISYS